MPTIELYGAARCPYTEEMRDWLEFRHCEFTEYDVDQDADARARLHMLTNGQRMVPVLVEDGKVTHIGWQGHGCAVGDE